jgi:ATP-dependent DNA helicase RecG
MARKLRRRSRSTKRANNALDRTRPARKRTDREYMEIAIREMLKSRSEHEDKFDPTVGSVLVDANGIEIDRAHRGKVRSGDHGEFTLLKKGSRGINAAEGTVYVTLEPCIGRKPPKKACARWIVEAKIARVVIGMVDPNPTIKNKGIHYLRSHGVEVSFFDPDLADQIRRHNKKFIEQFESITVQSEAKQDRPKEPAAFSGPAFEENNAVQTASEHDFLPEAIHKYLEGAHLKLKVPSRELWEEFVKRGFLVWDRTEHKYVPTLAGLVLFGANPEIPLPQCRIVADRFIGTFAEGTDVEQIAADGQAEIVGPFFRMVDDIKLFFEKHTGKIPQLEGSRRVFVREYPWEPIREAIVNAVVHRDYQDGVNVIFQIFRDRIVVKNPGLPPPQLSLNDIRAGKIRSYRRNPRIAAAATTMHYMEARGSGIKTMRTQLKKHGLREPDFEFENDFFFVTIYGREATPITVRTRPEILAKLNKRAIKLLEILDLQKSITANAWSEIASIGKQTAVNDLKELQVFELVERKGAGRATYYILK